MKLSTKTPCIGVCSTSISGNVCRGCKRFAHEVIAWNSYTPEQKHSVNQRIDHLLAQLVRERIDVYDAPLLEAKLDEQNIRHDKQSSVYLWAFQLLRAGATQIDDLGLFGCRLLPRYSEVSLPELKDALDRDFFVLSNAHYERYFRPPESH